LRHVAARSLRRGSLPVLAGSDLGVDAALSIYRTLATRYHEDAFDFELSLGYVYQAVNVQGSEDRAQHLSKRKLRPWLELPKPHLVFAG
jgi:hypothetical protein